MRVALLTREFPPDVYGGAGVHVDHLSRELAGLVDLDPHCLGAPRPGAIAHSEDDPRLATANPALRIFAANLEMAAAVGSAQLVHSHTWYANLAGHLGGRGSRSSSAADTGSPRGRRGRRTRALPR
jgi:starch synthase